MRNHASWGSMSDVMIVFLNQDAYDKYRLNEEDYELYKEVEKIQKKNNNKNDDDKKEDKKDDKKEEKDESNKSSKDITVELDGIEDRIVRLTPNSSNIGGAIITKDGENLYYLSAVEDGYDLWKIKLRKPDARIVSKLNAGYMSFEMDKSGNIFLLGSNSMKKLTPSSDKLTSMTY